MDDNNTTKNASHQGVLTNRSIYNASSSASVSADPYREHALRHVRDAFWEAYYQSLHTSFRSKQPVSIVQKCLQLYWRVYRALPSLLQLTDFMMTHTRDVYGYLHIQFPTETMDSIRACTVHMFIMCGHIPREHYIELALYFKQREARLPTEEEMLALRTASSDALLHSFHASTSHTQPLLSPLDVTLIENKIHYEYNITNVITCSICQESIETDQQVARLPCLHRFHAEDCIKPWIQISSRCPNCRACILSC